MPDERAAPPVAIAGGRLRWAWWEWLAGLAVILLPCGLLFAPGANFYYDWHNHQWLVGYLGEQVRSQRELPEMLNVAGAVGMPQPVFYGFLLYPGLGALAAVGGASLALRMGIALALGAQCFAVYLAGRRMLGHRGASWVIAASVTWGVHSLTNLYNRAALTEFFAVAFLTTAVALGLAAMGAGRGRRERLAGGGAALVFAVLTVGAHPPTALVSAGLAGLLVLGSLGRAGGGAVRPPGESVAGHDAGGGVKKSQLEGWVWVVLAGLAAAVLLPWLYVNLVFRGELGIVGKYRDFSYSVGHIDAVAARFAPLPPDFLWPVAGKAGETPFVEAPLVFALLLLLGWHAVIGWRMRGQDETRGTREAAPPRWLALVGAGWFALMLGLSLSPVVGGAFRFLAPYVQFATRFTSHANLGLLILVLATGGRVAARGGYARYRRGTGVVLAAAFALALAAGVLKLRHAASVREPGGEPQYAWRGDRGALVTSGKVDAAGDYAVLKRLPQLTPSVAARATRANLPVGSAGRGFGQVGEMRIALQTPGWVITNVVAHPWNRVTVDGREVPPEQRAAQEYRLALHLSAGNHVLGWQWRPDSVWRGLTALSRLSLAGLIAAVVVFLARRN